MGGLVRRGPRHGVADGGGGGAQCCSWQARTDAAPGGGASARQTMAEDSVAQPDWFLEIGGRSFGGVRLENYSAGMGSWNN
jgi:hypothetical protein